MKEKVFLTAGVLCLAYYEMCIRDRAKGAITLNIAQ